MRILILHDFFSVKGGAEYVALTLLNKLQPSFSVSLVTGYVNYDLFPELVDRQDIKTLCGPTRKKGWESLKMTWLFKNYARETANFDVCIYSGIYSIAASLNSETHKNIYYCHAPPRFVYDLKTYYQKEATFWQKPLLSILRYFVRSHFENSILKMDRILANSFNIQRRLKKYLDVESTLVYPPVPVNKYQWLGTSNYYLSTARLEPYKRIELVVRAFMEMPEKKLVVASSGSLLNYLVRLTKDHENISFTGWTSKNQLMELTGNCIATIYIPMDEDFGMSPVESMAAGKPVIGVNEGGIRETVLDKVTGLLLPPSPTIDQLKNAIHFLTAAKSQSMKDECIRHALKFNTDIFMSRITSAILEPRDNNHNE